MNFRVKSINTNQYDTTYSPSVNSKNSLIETFKAPLVKMRGLLLAIRSQTSKLSASFDRVGNDSSKFDKFKNVDYLRFARPLAVLIFAILLLSGLRNFINRDNSPEDNSERVEVQGAKAENEINREFIFPLRDAEGEEISQIKYVVEKAELRDEIVVQGSKATAVKGRTFLIVTLKITNEFGQSIQMDTKDYIRLSVNGNQDDWLAPDIHNDPVEVQAISTKYTRVGIPIDDDVKDIILSVGEIDGEKETLNLNFK